MNFWKKAALRPEKSACTVEMANYRSNFLRFRLESEKVIQSVVMDVVTRRVRILDADLLLDSKETR